MFLVLTIPQTTYGVSELVIPWMTTHQYFATPQNDLHLVTEHLPNWYYPQDPEAIRQMFEGSEDGSVPWRPWLYPLLMQTLLMGLVYFAGYCLVNMFRKQWTDRERLRFPLLLVPVAFIGLVAWMFGRTLRPGRLPLITRLVTILDDTPVECLEPEVLRYARGVTLGWTLLLLLLGAVNLALAMIATPDGLLAQLGLQPPVAITRTQWSWFANLFNYGIIAAFFVAEFQLRKRRFPGRYPSFAGFLRRLGALGPAFWRDQLR